MSLPPIIGRYDQQRKEYYDVSNCHRCYVTLDWRQSYYQDSFGRWEFCCSCYVHVQRDKKQTDDTLARWYAIERMSEINRDRRLNRQ